MGKVPPAFKEELKMKANICKALSNPKRLCIVRRLRMYGELNVTAFVDCMDTSQSNISQHLAKLRDAGIIDSRKEGLNVIYFLKNDLVADIVSLMFPEVNDNL